MEEKNKYVVFIDLDKTLLLVNSGKILVMTAYNKGLMSFSSLLKAFVISIIYKLNIKNDYEVVERMTKWLKGLSETSIINISQNIVEKKLISLIRPSIIKEIQFHEKQGGHIVLLSASLPYICEPIAKHIGIKTIICSKMEIKNKLFTGKLIGNICIGDEKKIRAEDYCKQKAFKLSNAFCYGDSITDQHVLNLIGNPICVEPDKKLQKLAIKKNWKIIY